MNDAHYEEIRLSRELAKEIGQVVEQFGQVVPHSVMAAYTRLLQHYAKEIEEGIQ